MSPLVRWLVPVLLVACTQDAPAPDTGTPVAHETSDTDVSYAPDVLEPDMLDPRWLQIGTFNIRWLNDKLLQGEVPRNDIDYAMIADLIQAMDVDLLALQEIDGARALQLLELPDPWRWKVSESGSSVRTAWLYRSDKLSLEHTHEVPLTTSTSSGHRNPFVAEVTSRGSGTRYTVINLHLKPYSDPESVQIRSQQVREIHAWLADARTSRDTPVRSELILVGDMNDTVEGIGEATALGPLLTDDALHHISAGCEGGTWIPGDSLIDHLFIASDLADRVRRKEGACRITDFDRRVPWRNYEGGQDGLQNISDHRPTWFYLQD